MDLNLKFAYHLLSPKAQNEGYLEILKLLKDDSQGENLKWNTLKESYEMVQTNLKDSIRILTEESNSTVESFKWANGIVELAFGIASAKYNPDYFSHTHYLTSTSPTNELDYEVYLNASNGIVHDFFNEYVDKIPPCKLIGISVSSSEQLLPALLLSKIIKRRNPDCSIFFGGTYITLITDELNAKSLIWEYVDFILSGDGEVSTLTLIEEYYSDKNYENVPNLCFVQDKKMHKSKHKLHTSMCEMSYGNYDDAELENYFSRQKRLPILLNAGCYWSKCAFCCDTYFEHSIESRKIESIIGEIKSYIQTYGVKRFDFISLAVTPLEIWEIAKYIIKEELDIKWQCWSRFDGKWSKEIFETLFQAGCERISFGLESGSQRVLKLMSKGIAIAKCPQTINQCKEAGIKVSLFMMTGFPTETEEEAWATYKFVEEHKENISIVQHSYFTLDNQSLMRNELDKYGLQIKSEAVSLGFTSDFKSTMGMSREASYTTYLEIHEALGKYFDPLVAEWDYISGSDNKCVESAYEISDINAFINNSRDADLEKKFLKVDIRNREVLYSITHDKYYELA